MLYKLGVGSLGVGATSSLLRQHGFKVIASSRSGIFEDVVWVKCDDKDRAFLLSIVAPGTVELAGALEASEIQQKIETAYRDVFPDVWKIL